MPKIGPKFSISTTAASGIHTLTTAQQENVAGNWPGLVEVSGGTETTYNGYKYHTFTSTGTFTVSGGTLEDIHYLIVGGGGGGGGSFPIYACGGGGAAGAYSIYSFRH